ncbi:MAG: cell division protein SepF [Oscillospiraceae bacterium]|nr:cell division protein SepF [Oscillospiraceae bacterium]
MSFLDKIKNIVNVDEDGYYPDDDPQDADYGSNDRFFEPSEERGSRPSYQRAQRQSEQEKVVNIHTTAQLQVVLSKPEKFDEVSGIADNLNEKRTVVLNLESVNKETARRLIDFLSGVAYANNGQLKRVANSTFIITPYNVDVMGDLMEELENNGMFF